MIYVTGDTHGERAHFVHSREEKTWTEQNYLIVCGASARVPSPLCGGELCLHSMQDQKGQIELKNRNTLSSNLFLIETLLWLGTTMIMFRNIFFTVIPGRTATWSENFLWIMASAVAVLGYMITYQERRNTVSLAVNTLLPYEIYAVIAFHTYAPGLVWGTLAFSLVLAAAFLILAAMPDRQRERKTGLWRRLRHGLLGARTIAAFCMLAMLVPLGIRILVNDGMLATSIKPVASAAQASEWTVNNKIDTVRLLEEEEWENLTVQEKLDVLGTVVNIEVNYLGLSHELNLKSGDLEGNVAAHYNNRYHEIVIDLELLQSWPADELLESLCHECYHDYQREMIELYRAAPEEYREMQVFDCVKDYIEEFSNYNSGTGDNDIDEYYRQRVEIEARNYGRDAVWEYYELIDEYT